MKPESNTVSTKALSIRQPWAWLVVNGYKTIENRSRNIGNHFGPVMIHASHTMTLKDYGNCLLFISKRCPDGGKIMEVLPDFKTLKKQCGGIVGIASVTGHGSFNLTSPWYTGGYWYLLTQASPLPFVPFKGRLGFFKINVTVHNPPIL